MQRSPIRLNLQVVSRSGRRSDGVELTEALLVAPLPLSKSLEERKMSLLFIGTRVAPVAATVMIIATLVTCVSIAKANERYLGGLAWPYFSDTGRDIPGYAVFCAGLTTVSVALVLTWSANYQYQSELLRGETDPSASTIRNYCKAVRIIGVLSALELSILAFFSTTSYPDVHQYAAYWFFVLEAVALVLNTIASYKLSRLNKVLHNHGAGP
ncbi:hypothetical protein V7S43_014783 [Phytophthora oleae]|uniref:CWH43-like N-terminal domain-containing protein n=1 Tax=Phytophthora oleae TaxID=2107226 RepID=A0ABD3F0D6_9STRA